MLEFLWIFWTALFALLTLNTFYPLSHSQSSPTGHVLSFGASWLFGDLAPQWLVLNAGMLSLLLTITPSSAWVLALLLVHGLCGAVLLRRWSRHQQLPQGLQIDSNAPFPFQPTTASDWWPTIWLPKACPPGVKRIPGLHYCTEQTDARLLDLYLPDPMPPAALPLLLHVHGGGWHVGTNNQGLPLIHYLVQHGWACATMTYRLCPEHRYPAALEDVLSAARFLQEHAEAYSLQPQQFFLSGSSAGAHLASLAAFAAPQQGLLLKGCVGYYGFYDFRAPFDTVSPYPAAQELLRQVLPLHRESDPEAQKEASPLHQVPAQPVPFLLIHGLRDTLVPWRESRAFAQALRRQGGEATELYAPGLQHAFDLLPSLAAWQMRDPVAQWLKHQLLR